MLRHLWWVVGLVLVVGGVLLTVLTRTDPAQTDFGWFAYAPLSQSSDWLMGLPDPGTGGGSVVWFVSLWQLVGAASTVVGLLVLASGVGFRLGRRRGRPVAG